MNDKHTPGPWTVVDRKHWSASIPLVVTGKPTPVAWASRLSKHGDDEALANASLIAAAPDLLEALRGLLYDRDSHGEVCKTDPCAKCRARAAIAKAEGIDPKNSRST